MLYSEKVRHSSSGLPENPKDEVDKTPKGMVNSRNNFIEPI